MGDLMTCGGSTILAPARPAAKGKLFTSLPEAKIVKREDVISWSWRLRNSRDVAISEKVKACEFSAITIWLASRNKLNNPKQDFKASPTPNGWAKADNFEADSLVVQFEQIKLISNCQNLVKQTQRKIYPPEILFQTKISLNQEEIFLSTERDTLYCKYSSLFFWD